MRSLSRKRKAELEEIVRKDYTNWDGMITGRRSRPTIYERRGTLAYVVSSVEETACCGLVQIEGLGPISNSRLTGNRAYFQLWLHQPWVSESDTDEGDERDVAAVLATTARSGPDPLEIERFLASVGFKAASSGENPNTGNIVTVWIYAAAPDELQALTPPKE